jgi:hypothetical protein
MGVVIEICAKYPGGATDIYMYLYIYIYNIIILYPIPVHTPACINIP